MNSNRENGQRRRAEEMYPLVAKYERSNKPQQDFCAEHGLEVHILNYWLGKYRKEKGRRAKPKGGFISLEVEPPETGNGPNPMVEITYPDGTAIRFYEAVKPGYLKALV